MRTLCLRLPLWRQCLLTLAAFWPASGSVIAAPANVNAMVMPRYERVQLENGAVLLLMERHDVPLIAFDAVVRGGALGDSHGKYGTASLLAALLEKGAGKRDAYEFAQTVASVGGVIETDADVDHLVVSGNFLAQDQTLMVELLADMLIRPRLEREEFESLRSRHIDFIRATKDSDLGTLLPIYGAAALFGNHPYGRPVSGSEASLARIAYDDVQRYYRDHVGANRLVLAVVGDFDSRQLKRQLTRAFAKWGKAAEPLPIVPAPQRSQGRKVLLIDAPTSVQSYLWAGNIGVSRSYAQRAALDIANTLFGGRFTSMLNSELRVRSGLTYGARSRFERRQQPGSWYMSSFTQTETTSQALDLAFEVLDRLHQGALTDEAIASGKTYVQGQYALGFETAEQWASQLAQLEFYGLDSSYISNYPAALGAVTLEQARAVIKETFPRTDNLLLVVIGNAAAIREKLRRYGAITEMQLSQPVFSVQELQITHEAAAVQ